MYRYVKALNPQAAQASTQQPVATDYERAGDKNGYKPYGDGDVVRI